MSRSRYSSSQNPRHRGLGDRSRSRSPHGGCDKDTGTTLCIDGAAAAELDEEIFVRLEEFFPTVDVVLNNTEITFFGDTRKKADSMMFLFRYLKNEKMINCPRWIFGFWLSLNLTFIVLFCRLRDEASELKKSLSGKPRLARTVQSEPQPRPQKETETERQIKALQKMLKEKEDRMKETVSNLEDAKKEIKTAAAEKLELMLKLQNYQKAKESDKNHFEALLEKSREEVENQKTTIAKLEKKNEETLKQLKFQGKYFKSK